MKNLQLFSEVFFFFFNHQRLWVKSLTSADVSNETSAEKIDEKIWPGFSVLLTKMQLASSVRGVLTETHI